MTSVKAQFRSLTAYELHKRLINDYVLNKPGATQLLKRDQSKDKYDSDVIKENHRFLWDNVDGSDLTWEEQLAKKYCDKLFKEYCIADLTKYKENLLGLRWRIEKEVVTGRGQFTCGNKHCDVGDENLRTWEVNFAYIELGEKKNALVKLRLCPECSVKLNYRSQKREIKRQKNKHKRRRKSSNSEVEIIGKRRKSDIQELEKNDETVNELATTSQELPDDDSIWKKPREEELQKDRGDEFEEFLEELFL